MDSARRGAAVALLLVAGLHGCVTADPDAGSDVTLPGPGVGDQPGRAARAVEVARACEECHADIASEQRLSRHASAFTNSAFQTALQKDNLPFCRSCHAPEAPQNTAPPADLGGLGVGCATCHLAGDTILAAPSDRPLRAPHRVARSARFAEESACAGCHQFAFLGDKLPGVPDLMQLTIEEHEISAYSNVSCAGCHMPLVGEGPRRHRSHRFSGSRTPEEQARALRITASRASPTEIEIEIAPGEVGHAYPTGDLFRRLEVRVEAVTSEGAVVAREVRYLARHFERRLSPSGHPVRALLWDDRPGAPGPAAEGVTLRMDLGAASADRLFDLRVSLQRVAQLVEGRPERESPVESESLLFSSVLPPETPSREGP